MKNWTPADLKVGDQVRWSPALADIYQDLQDVFGKIVQRSGYWLVIEVPVTADHVAPFTVRQDWTVQPA